MDKNRFDEVINNMSQKEKYIGVFSLAGLFFRNLAGISFFAIALLLLDDMFKNNLDQSTKST